MKIYVVGWPRSGTHLLLELLKRSTGMDVQHSHPILDSPDKDNRYVFTTRDPRDAFASHWLLYGGNNPKRSQLDHLELFFKGKEMKQEHLHLGWAGYMKRWREVVCSTFFLDATRHEWIMANPRLSIAHIIYRLELPVDEVRIDSAVNSVKGFRCDPSSFPPDDMGRIGKWKDTLEENIVSILWDYCGNVAETLGYQR